MSKGACLGPHFFDINSICQTLDFISWQICFERAVCPCFRAHLCLIIVEHGHTHRSFKTYESPNEIEKQKNHTNVILAKYR